MKTPVKVRVMYAKDNVRRVNEFQLEKPALAKAGFDLVDNGSTEWSAKLGDGTYDAVFFGWESTSAAVSADQAIYATGEVNNLVGYSNKKVDALFDQLLVRLPTWASRSSCRPRSRRSCTTTPSGSRSSSSRRRTSPTRPE